MTKYDFQADMAVDVVTKALDDYLRDKNLKITPQKYGRLKKLLMVTLLEQDITYENAYNTLSEIGDYRKDYEIDANASDEAEEEMIRIIGAADLNEAEVLVETTKFKKRFLVSVGLLSVFCLGLIGFGMNQYFEAKKLEAFEMTKVISTQDEVQFKELVQALVELEKLNGNDITHNAIYNQVKNLDSVKNAGNATSYKKFNVMQLSAATAYINERIANIEPAAGLTPPSEDGLSGPTNVGLD